MALLRVAMLLCCILLSGFVSTHAQLSQILQVAGETANKAADAATKPTVPKNFKMPKQINSYADYLKYAGQANGIIPVTPEAESDAAMSPNAAPGPMSGGGALAPATAMAAMGQPSLQSFQQGADGNFNPTIQDWVTAYKPVDKALNKVFETRITNSNARQVQFNLAVAAAPLQMLINDQVIKQQQEGKTFISNLVSTFSGKKDASSLFSNPLTGRTTTAPTAAAPAPVAETGSTVTAANPAISTSTAQLMGSSSQGAPASSVSLATAAAPVATATAPAPAMATSLAAGDGGTALQANAGEQAYTGGTASLEQAARTPPNPLSSLLATFGKRKLLLK